MPKKPEVIFSATPVVRIEIEGEKIKNLPQTFLSRKDGGLIRRLREFLRQQNITPVFVSGMNGGGRYVGFFSPEEAGKIKAWLHEQGCEEENEE